MDPPRHVEVLEPRTTIRPGSNTVKGAVFDVDSITVPTITLQAQDPSSNITDLTCPDPTPDDAHWACDWDAGLGVSDGDQFKLRVQATNRLGHASDWTDWLTLTVKMHWGSGSCGCATAGQTKMQASTTAAV